MDSRDPIDTIEQDKYIQFLYRKKSDVVSKYNKKFVVCEESGEIRPLPLTKEDEDKIAYLDDLIEVRLKALFLSKSNLLTSLQSNMKAAVYKKQVWHVRVDQEKLDKVLQIDQKASDFYQNNFQAISEELVMKQDAAYNALLEYEKNCILKYDDPMNILPSKIPKAGERMIDYAQRYGTTVQEMKKYWRQVEQEIQRQSEEL